MSALAGVSVVALEQAVAAPYCSRRLAEAGADVIKVERPEGDFARHYDTAVDGASAYFVWLNYGKRSIVLDLREKTDLDTLRALVTRADVFIQNLKPGALESLGFSLADARRENPELISCSIAGYSSRGPSRAKKAYDLLIQAETGLASITGSPHEPGRVGVSVCDIACGMFAYDAILLALIERAGTKVGKHLEVTLFDALAQWLAVPYLLERYTGKAPERVGIAHPGIAPYGVFASADGRSFVLCVQNEREWARLCSDVLKMPAWITDVRTASNERRVEHRTLVDSEVARCAGEFDYSQLSEMLLKADIAHAAVNDLRGLREHADFQTQEVRYGDQRIQVPIVPGSTPSTDSSLSALTIPSIPALGQHTEEIRAQLANRILQNGQK